MSVSILNGCAIDILRTLPAESVNCVVTSPPYYGLRDYGITGQIGLEQTPAAFIARLVEVFEGVRRVLRPDGTLWVNMGDSYAGSGKGVWNVPDERKEHVKETYRPKVNPIKRGSSLPAGFHKDAVDAVDAGAIGRAWVPAPDGFKNKDLMGMPWRLAFALQDAGWFLRSDIIWHKPNPMPESIRDRPTKSHEYIFLLSKSSTYYYDGDAIREKSVCSDDPRLNEGRLTYDGKRQGEPGQGQEAFVSISDTRNKRTVWTVSTTGYEGAHFATFPPALIRPCILAGCPVGGTVLDPFGGSGTTGEVAEQEGRNSILIEINPAYVALAKQRTAQTGLFAGGAVA